jgi:NhaP-type Na+/H+ and K+/H+ antiporter
MIPRGEGAAVLASLPLIHGLPRPDVFLNLAFVLIFLSVIYTTISIWYIHRKPKKESGRPEP